MMSFLEDKESGSGPLRLNRTFYPNCSENQETQYDPIGDEDVCHVCDVCDAEQK